MKLSTLHQASPAPRRHASHLIPLLLALAVSQAYAAPLRGADVTATQSANGPGPVAVRAVANGGAGEAGVGREEVGESGAAGGAAQAHASGVTQGSGSATVVAEAFGGNGGDQGLAWYDNDSYYGGKGGDAGASATGQSGSGAVSVTARATGGNGGAGYYSTLSGNGGGVALVNAVSGATSGVLTLSQEANGGTSVTGGGIHNFEWFDSRVRGGDAASTLTLSDAGASAVKVNISAVGGYGLNGGGGRGALTLSSTREGASLEGTVLGRGGSSSNGTGGAGSSVLVLQGSGDVLGRSTAIGGGDQGYAYFGGGNATSSVNAVGGGAVDARALANGGNNRSANGGAATATAFGQSSGGPVYVSASAVGGNGYEGAGASASARGVSTGGGTVTVLAHARGGDFNDSFDWHTSYGSVSLDNAVSGSTSGLLTLTQTAEAGFGGGASSVLTLTDALASGVSATVSARGGDNANGSPGGATASLRLGSTVQGAAVSGTAIAIDGRSSGPSGGATSLAQTSALGAATSISRSESGYHGYGTAASAVAQATSNNAADASATSLGGTSGTASASSRTLLAGGRSAAYAVVATTDYANAKASATGVGAALITAVAQGSGTSGIVQADSGASGGGLRVAAVATAPVFGSARAESAANVGGPSYSLPSLGAAQVISNVSGVTDGGASILPAGGPLAALAGTLVGSGVQAASYAPEAAGNVVTYVTSGAFQFSAAADQHLLLGFLGASSLNTGFDLLNLTISNNGAALYSHSFSTLDEANLFFNAQVLDLGLLGAGLQDVTVTSELIASSANGYAFSYVIGSGLLTATAVPEPSTWLLLLLGATVLLVTRRRATSEGAVS